ncbi:MAG: hypothetical protein Q8R26_01845 [bacterium]|nr:hypothetical protein [bacterium]
MDNTEELIKRADIQKIAEEVRDIMDEYGLDEDDVVELKTDRTKIKSK